MPRMFAALARPSINQAVRDHLFLFGIPLFALAMDVYPSAEAFFVCESAVGDLDRNLTVLLATSIY